MNGISVAGEGMEMLAAAPAAETAASVGVSPVDRAYADWLRQRHNADAQPEAYAARFPDVQSSLTRLIRAHVELEAAICWPQAGDTFLGFRLIRQLGAGSIARVFLAGETLLGGRHVAVKLAVRGWSEAGLMGRITHPHIVPVHSVQIHRPSGLTVVCMPYLGSATLCDVLKRLAEVAAFPGRAAVILEAIRQAAVAEEPASSAALPPAILRKGTCIDGIRHLGAQIADALAYLHDCGIYHRDLKPSNVLLTPAGAAMLLDFNLSADVNRGAATLGGTLPYMAPEQLRAGKDAGKTPLLDGRSDIYSLGVILYQLLTGAHPLGPLPPHFKAGELADLLERLLPHGPRPLRELRPEVDRPLATLVERCLAYDADDRPQTAAEVAAALRRQLSPVRRGGRWLKRQPRRTAAAAVLLLTLATLAAFLWLSRPPYSERQFQQGRALYRQGQYSEAVHCFSAALEADPARTDALFARGRAYQQWAGADKRYYDSAITDYALADKLAPSGRNKACIGYCFSRLGQPYGARGWYDAAIAAGFAPAEVLNNRGCAQLQLKDVEEAVESLSEAIKRKPNLQAALYNRARARRQEALALRSSLKGPASAEVDRRIRVVLQNGLADIRQALAAAPSVARLYRDAAHLCLLASADNRELKREALSYLSLAVEHGDDPRKLAGDRRFELLKNEPQFKLLSQRGAPLHPPRDLELFLDPIDKNGE
jgi:eukaryotic-like serine/threonine-protein kinase